MLRPCYDTVPLDTGDYIDGEVYVLDPLSTLGRAIMDETWLNMAMGTQTRWKEIMTMPSVYLLGTVLSIPRQQVELTIASRQAIPGMGVYAKFCVTLAHFNRFL